MSRFSSSGGTYRSGRRRCLERGCRDRDRASDLAGGPLPGAASQCSTSATAISRSIWCSELRIETSGAGGRESEATLLHIDGDVVYADESLDHPQLLRRLGHRLGLELDDTPHRADHREQARRRDPQAPARCSQGDGRCRPSSPIVVSEDRLRAELPASLFAAAEDLSRPLDHHELARLAFAVHGVETLKVFREDFEDAGLQPPRTWAGSREAVDFVRRPGIRPAARGLPGRQPRSRARGRRPSRTQGPSPVPVGGRRRRSTSSSRSTRLRVGHAE